MTPGRSAVLPQGMAAEVLRQCSRPAPSFEATWQIAADDVDQLERDLPRLNGMKARGCCIAGAAIENVDQYFRQYAGIVVGGRRYIYINAFPVDTFDDWPPQVPIPDWKQEPFQACDGGFAYWGVLYDPVTRRFSELAFNGIA